MFQPTQIKPRTGVGALAAVVLGVLVAAAPMAQARPAPDGFSTLAAKVTPAVVNISTTQKVERAPGELPQMPFPPGSPFEEFFKRFFDQQGQLERGPAKMTALGSGFIIDASGYVVTNNHVVGDADKIDVTLADGRKFDAKLVGRDDKTDLALLKIKADAPLPFVNFGDSDKAQVGDWVVAVGNPFGLGGTVTAGIVSARGRDIRSGPFDDFLQIDASINRGNSGGPTFNMDGDVIGVNTAIYSPNGGSVGIGFAIPASAAKPVITALREHGKVERGWLGVQIQEVTPEIASSLGLNEHKGALVAAVSADGPAAKAGVKQGDVILAVGGQDVERIKDLPRLIAAEKAGRTETLKLWRNGETRQVEVKIGSMPADQRVAESDDAQPQAPAKVGVLGLSLAPITAEARTRLGLDRTANGVLITAVRPDSPAADQGLQTGDVLVKVGDDSVSSPRQVREAVEKAEKQGRNAVLLLVARRGGQQFVALPIGKA